MSVSWETFCCEFCCESIRHRNKKNQPVDYSRAHEPVHYKTAQRNDSGYEQDRNLEVPLVTKNPGAVDSSPRNANVQNDQIKKDVVIPQPNKKKDVVVVRTQEGKNDDGNRDGMIEPGVLHAPLLAEYPVY